MKLVQFACTVMQLRAIRKEEGKMEAHLIYINPDDVQMLTPEQNETEGHTTIIFKQNGGSTTVSGTLDVVAATLTAV